ncbi:plasmid pRiA4b ORF-3 family protein [Dehalococcoidia bacterium]|nr:plasmid pRiA4b ORF-3 family protein [Dehalococcoidia bacterium]
MGYVYDFGDEILHNVTLEKIVQPEKGVEYPRVIAENKPRYRYCERCQEQGKKTIAAWICIECSEEEGREVLLCEDCLEEEHEDHYADEILY